MIEAEDVKNKEEIAKSDDNDAFQEALTRGNSVMEVEQENRQKSVEDILFAQSEEGQWGDDNEGRSSDRPRFTINRCAPAVDQIVGEQRKNEISIKFRPKAGADKDMADTLRGLVKNIEEESTARDVYDQAFHEMLNGGYGGWKVLTKFSDDDTFDQDIVISPIDSATTSLFFGPASKYDKSDAPWAFLFNEMPVDQFRAKYPGKTESSVSEIDTHNGLNNCSLWFKDEVVRVGQYWRKTPIEKEIVLMSDGKVHDAKDLELISDELVQSGITEQKRRKVKTFKVESREMSGAEWLGPWQEWAGSFIPLIPVFGKVTKVQGVELVRGLIRFAKDPQMMLNYAESTIVEVAAQSPKDPIWMTAEQAKGYEGELQRMNVENKPVYLYNHDVNEPGAPKRTGAPQVQQALVGVVQQSILDLNAVLNVTPSGAQPLSGSPLDTRSGRAIAATQTQENTAAFVFIDNLVKSIRYTGTILADLIPKVYDGERQIRTIKPDGTEEFVMINQTVMDEQTREEVVLNDLSQGKFDIAVDTGPAFATLQNEAANMLRDLATESEVFAQLTPDILAKNLDIPGSDELHDRLRKQMIQNGIAEPTEEEVEKFKLNEPQQPSEEQMIALEGQKANVRLIHAQAEQLEAAAEKARADAMQSLAKGENVDIDSNKKAVEAVGVNLDNITKQFDMGLPLGEQEHDIRIGQNDIVEQTQEAVSPGGTSEEQLENNQEALNIINQQQLLEQ